MPFVNALNELGLATFGLGMPRIAWSPWALGPAVNFNPQPTDLLSFTADVGGQPAPWAALLPGTSRRVQAGSYGVQLLAGDGSTISDFGVLVTVTPQVYRRLSFLYARALEGQPNGRNVPVRPVPRYFLYTGEVQGGNANVTLDGGIEPTELVGNFNTLRIFDAEGQPMPPHAVFAQFARLLSLFPPLTAMPVLGAPPPLQNGFDALLGNMTWPGPPPAAPATIVRLTDASGLPLQQQANINGLVAIPNNPGLYYTNAAAVAVAQVGASQNVIGSPHGGPAWTANFTPPALAGPLAGLVGQEAPLAGLPLDFYSLRVVDLQSWLLGPRPTDFTAVQAPGMPQPVQLETRPTVRTAQNLTLLSDGNQVAAAAGFIAGSAAPQRYVAAQDMDPGLVVPVPPPGPVFGPTTRWPLFPAIGAIGPQLPANFLATFPLTMTARPINGPNPNDRDVLLTITPPNNFPVGLAIRVYTRNFGSDTRETRGDGAGGLLTANVPLALVLRDPLGLHPPGQATGDFTPTSTLIFDIVLTSVAVDVDGNPRSRVYGDLQVAIVGPAVPPPAAPAGGPFTPNAVPGGNGLFGAVANAQIVGLRPTWAGITGPSDLLDFLMGVENEAAGAPIRRETIRLPTMAWREVIVADTNQALVSGGRLTGELLSAQARLGAPGTPGGREVQAAGVYIPNGPLATDVALIALRRTRAFPADMLVLMGANFDPRPVAPGGTFAAAVLQNVAPVAETPLLHLAPNSIANLALSLPNYGAAAAKADLDTFMGWVQNTVRNDAIVVFGQTIQPHEDAANLIDTARAAITGTAGVAPSPGPGLGPTQVTGGATQAAVDARYDRVRAELTRRIVTATYGRHDSEWALRGALARARRFIYIETPGLASNHFDPAGNIGADDLLAQLQARMSQVPELQVVVCIPKYTDYPACYAEAIRLEMLDRKARLAALPQGRLRVFHPTGFRGRPSRLATTTVIVDDTWALVGASSLRRRGLRFDGSVDVVLTDTVYEAGVCPAIARFRQALLAQRLGVPPAVRTMPHPDFTRLYDGVEAFEVVGECLARGEGIEPLYTAEFADLAISDKLRAQANPDGMQVAGTTPEAIFEMIGLEMIVSLGAD